METLSTNQQINAAISEFDRLHAEGSERFGMLWLRMNMLVNGLTNAPYAPADARTKTLLSAAAFAFAEHIMSVKTIEPPTAEGTNHADEITVRLLLAERRVQELESENHRLRSDANTSSASTDLEALQAEYDSNAERLNDVRSHYPESYPLIPEYQSLFKRQRAIEPLIHPAADEPDYDAYLAEQQRQHEAHVDALEAEWEVKKFIDDNGYHPDEHYPGRSRVNEDDSADDPDVNGDLPEVDPAWVHPDCLPELRRYADGEWHAVGNQEDADVLEVTGLLEWDGKFNPQQYRISHYGREALNRNPETDKE